MIDPELKRWATPLQIEAIDATIASGGNVSRAAASLGISRESIRSRLDKVKRNAARAGYAPQEHYTHPVPEGFHVKGASQLFRRGEPEPILTWVKSAKDVEDQRTALLEAFEALDVSWAGRAKLIRPPKIISEEWLTVYPMGDPHIGMLAWHLETGEDFDTKIAGANLRAAMAGLVSGAPPSKLAYIVNLGDFFHSDTPLNRTSRSGHPLDVDSRWAKTIRVGVSLMIDCIDLALQKHEQVHVVCEIGNHDDMSAAWLAQCLKAWYRNEPRVTIDDSPSPYHKLRFGTNLLGVTHGHNCPASRLGQIMAEDWKEDWGETMQRKWYTGHVHHDSLKEFPGVDVETFRTLASRDMYHHSAGYRSRRDMKADSWHVEKGLKLRQIINVEELRKAA